MIKKILYLVPLIVLLHAPVVFADGLCSDHIPGYTFGSLPAIINFDTDAWKVPYGCVECGGTSTHVTSGCYGGGCMKVTPPTSNCTGGGADAGANGIGWLVYPNTNPEFHIRFLIKIQPGYVNGCCEDGTKFYLQDGSERSGILQLRCDDYGGRYCAFGVWGASNVNYYAKSDDWHVYQWEAAPFKITPTSRSGEWIAIEYYINETTNLTGMYLWTQDGVWSGKYIDDVPAMDGGGTQTAGYFSYFNGYGSSGDDVYYLVDNIVISNTYIGPPEGFVGGSTPTRKLQNVTGVRVTLH